MMLLLSYVRLDPLMRLIALASLVSWCVSLLLPAITLGSFSVPGWQFLMQGWKGLTSLNVGGLSWLANPLLVVSWLAFTFPRYRLVAPVCAGLALLAALTSFLFNLLGGAEAGLLISAYDVGFYLWLGSTFLQTAASMLQMQLKKRGAFNA